MKSITIALLGILLTGGTVSAQTIAEQGRVLRDFERSVANYTMHLACLDPAHQANATPAPRIFTLPVAMMFRQLIARALDEGAMPMELLEYPPPLERALPQLPGQLEYQLIGTDLVLRDRSRNVIVDVMRDALGAVSTTRR
jgi:hypothetical protein